MQAEELEKYFDGPAGLPGTGRDIKPECASRSEDGLTVIVDMSLEGRKNMVCGANKLDYHLRNVTPGRDFTWTLAADIRSVNEGEGCPNGGLRRQARRRQGRRGRPHLQARLQVFRIDGRARAR